jgi:hypothetical protein
MAAKTLKRLRKGIVGAAARMAENLGRGINLVIRYLMGEAFRLQSSPAPLSGVGLLACIDKSRMV